ncbi:hypothetical protein [Escherichia coli]|uniref:hypothetical protein n=1 Tax=Escherichia coli TaxID=562 RepID=UPI0033902301
MCIAADGQADWENFKDGTLLYSVTPAPLSIDERAAFNAWNNEDNLPIAGVGAKNAAWLAWQARAKLGSPPAPVVPENYVTAEHRRVIEMLLNVCGAAFELADDSCQQEVDGEECHVVPDDAFQKLSDALDEIENTLPTEDVDRPDVFLAWSAMPRAALKSILQAGNSPVTGIDLASEPDRSVEVRYLAPPGYVIVPIVPTEDMIINGFESVPDPHFSDEKEWEEYEALSGCRQAARRAELCWAAMIKAAPKQENI